MVACKLYKKRRGSCQQRRKRGKEELTMSKSESDLGSSLDSFLIRFEELGLVEMLMVAIEGIEL